MNWLSENRQTQLHDCDDALACWKWPHRFCAVSKPIGQAIPTLGVGSEARPENACGGGADLTAPMGRVTRLG